MAKSATKVCRVCDKTKHVSDFERAPRGIRGVRATCKACRNKTQNWARIPEVPRFTRALDAKTYIITSAQSETFVHAAFLETLKVAAKHMNAELVVIPFRYRNPTSRTEQKKQEKTLWWDSNVEPYLHNTRKKLNDNLVLAADVKISPTAKSPVSELESLTGAESCIIGHPKMQFRTVPVPTGRYPKILTTTGTCTTKNYSDTKAGAIGAFHHFLGAVVVEISGKTFHLRQVNADRADGSFTDLNKHYTSGGVFDAPPALALVMGDTHVRVTSKGVDKATFGPGGMAETLQPKTIVFHDLFDGETVNPHEADDPFMSAAKQKAGRQDVRAELQQVVDFTNARAPGRDVVIVDSNHHDFLRRWVAKNLRYGCHDAKNMRLFLESAIAMYDSARVTDRGPEYDAPFAHWMRKLGAAANIRCLDPDESFKVSGIECGMHGDRGPNGARGSLKNLARLGSKVISGHTHSPGIEEGHYQVGTSTPRRVSYNRGPGSWLNSHCVVYASGKRSLLTVIDGAWRA